ncbi:flagellin [Paracoccus aerodenitrificans]|uniref:flagellin n=1 Tax=Paracoccus aerodenitrificans TaxID=3017781 RepID=UPI0022EFE45F|nr:flagellin [Paracoccus aerodenitrificans]WBU63875.1 flagellin [Paracoccus aerodenitrificans]
MSFVSVGDLSQMVMLRRSNAGLKTDIKHLAQEVTTGISTDIPKKLNGDIITLSAIERRLAGARVSLQISAEATATAETMQAALQTLQDSAGISGADMLSTSLLFSEHSLATVAAASENQLRQAVDALNVKVAGRFVFSGTMVDQAPLVSADRLIDMAEQQISGAATAEVAVQRLQNWFGAAPGSGGFTDLAYNGANSANNVFQLDGATSDGATSIEFAQKANDPGVRDVLRGLILGALVARGAFQDDHDARTMMMQAGGAALLDGNSKVTLSRSKLGSSQERIERGLARLQYMSAQLEIERSELVAVDSYEASSRILQTSSQLEALYALTARLSKLSLAKYL